MTPLHLPGPDAGPRIVTSCDWTGCSAWDDRYGADSSPIGRGDTEAEAREDLQWQLDEANDRHVDAAEEAADHRLRMMKESM